MAPALHQGAADLPPLPQQYAPPTPRDDCGMIVSSSPGCYSTDASAPEGNPYPALAKGSECRSAIGGTPAENISGEITIECNNLPHVGPVFERRSIMKRNRIFLVGVSRGQIISTKANQDRDPTVVAQPWPRGCCGGYVADEYVGGL